MELTSEAGCCGGGQLSDEELRTEVRLALLEQKQAGYECQVKEIKLAVANIEAKLDVVLTQAEKKPSWLITAVLTTMMSMLAGLIVFVATSV